MKNVCQEGDHKSIIHCFSCSRLFKSSRDCLMSAHSWEKTLLDLKWLISSLKKNESLCVWFLSPLLCFISHRFGGDCGQIGMEINTRVERHTFLPNACNFWAVRLHLFAFRLSELFCAALAQINWGCWMRVEILPPAFIACFSTRILSFYPTTPPILHENNEPRCTRPLQTHIHIYMSSLWINKQIRQK